MTKQSTPSTLSVIVGLLQLTQSGSSLPSFLLAFFGLPGALLTFGGTGLSSILQILASLVLITNKTTTKYKPYSEIVLFNL